MNAPTSPKRTIAARRNSTIGQLADLAPTLANTWHYSAKQCDEFTSALQSLAEDCPAILTLAAAGSYGRMEAAPHSDLDLVIIVDDAAGVDANARNECVQSVWEILTPLGIEKPLSSGIFMQAVSTAQLCDPAALGDLEYPRHVFGLRMQLLLDAQPIYGEASFNELVPKILKWYSSGCMQHQQLTPSRYLINDLIRYYRSYSVWHQFDDTQISTDSWALRQVKINHSRLFSYAALLALAHSADDANDANDAKRIDCWQTTMMSQLHLTPLERLHSLYTHSTTASVSTACTFNNLLEHYAHLLEQLADENVRRTLLTITATNLAALPAVDKRLFDELMLTNSQLRSSLGKLLFGSNVFHNQESDGLYALIL